MKNPFFKNKGPFKINQILKILNVKKLDKLGNFKIFDIKDLSNASKKDITFFHSKNYSQLAYLTKASYCITTENLSQFLPVTCKSIIVDDVLLSLAKGFLNIS